MEIMDIPSGVNGIFAVFLRIYQSVVSWIPEL